MTDDKKETGGQPQGAAPAPDRCEGSCEFARDVGMAPEHSCTEGHCVYAEYPERFQRAAPIAPAAGGAVQRPDLRDRADFRAAKHRADAARNFPTGTDPCSRHAYIMAENMVEKHGYPMLAEEPWHCAISIMYTVAALWEARAKLAALGDSDRAAAPPRHVSETDDKDPPLGAAMKEQE